jgi:hypothetical protein
MWQAIGIVIMAFAAVMYDRMGDESGGGGGGGGGAW